jgi:hypothetical protein
MNRSERRKAESIKRKVRAMKPAARELAIQTGMELHDALAEKREQEIRSMLEKEWASKHDKSITPSRAGGLNGNRQRRL